MEDTKLTGLKMAEFYWRKAFYADKGTKIAYAEDLHKYAMFSLSQIAKVVRLQTVELTRAGMKANSKGGRFEPETLSALISMRQYKLTGERVPARLIEITAEGGTSWSCAASLTGIPYSNYYKNVPEGRAAEISTLRLKPKDREAIVKAVRAGASRMKLAKEYQVHTTTVDRIVLEHANV